MYAEVELQALVALARKAGGDVVVIYDAELDKSEGRRIIHTVHVKSGIGGIGPHPMSAFYACERLREAKAKGLLGPVIRGVEIGPMPRPMPEGMRDALPRVSARLSTGEDLVLFEFYPDEIQFEESEFLGKTPEEALSLKRQKDARYLADAESVPRQRQR